jgi:hypothetical protein
MLDDDLYLLRDVVGVQAHPAHDRLAMNLRAERTMAGEQRLMDGQLLAELVADRSSISSGTISRFMRSDAADGTGP